MTREWQQRGKAGAILGSTRNLRRAAGALNTLSEVLAVLSVGLIFAVIAGAIVYLIGVLLVAWLMTSIFGDAPTLVVLVAVFWPSLLIPVLLAAAGYRWSGGRKLDDGPRSTRR